MLRDWMGGLRYETSSLRLFWRMGCGMGIVVEA